MSGGESHRRAEVTADGPGDDGSSRTPRPLQSQGLLDPRSGDLLTATRTEKGASPRSGATKEVGKVGG